VGRGWVNFVGDFVVDFVMDFGPAFCVCDGFGLIFPRRQNVIFKQPSTSNCCCRRINVLAMLR
jgi:hypothetical protein